MVKLMLSLNRQPIYNSKQNEIEEDLKTLKQFFESKGFKGLADDLLSRLKWNYEYLLEEKNTSKRKLRKQLRETLEDIHKYESKLLREIEDLKKINTNKDSKIEKLEKELEELKREFNHIKEYSDNLAKENNDLIERNGAYAEKVLNYEYSITPNLSKEKQELKVENEKLKNNDLKLIEKK